MGASFPDLWSRIQAFEFDKTGDAFPFTARLARENGWSHGYAHRVVDEYRRFLFLAMAAGHEVTPSEQVDEAWHLHLVYTKSYWEDLCGEVLNRPLHHHPTRGGTADAERHRQQYRRTLASYRSHFGEEAPADIWPPVEVRFGDDLNHVCINRERHWIVPKPRLSLSGSKSSTWLLAALVPAIGLGIVNPLNLRGPEFLVLYGILTAIVIIAALVLRAGLRRDGGSGGFREVDAIKLDALEVGCLGRGVAGVLQCCLAGLVTDGRLRIVESPAKRWGPVTLGDPTYRLESVTQRDVSATGLERAMLEAAAIPGGASPAAVLAAGKPMAQAVESELESRGLLETDESFGPARWWPVILIGGLVALGAMKLFVGIAHGKPVAFLAIWLVGLVVVALRFAHKPRRSKLGERVFKHLQREHQGLNAIDVSQPGRTAGSELLLATALFGLAAAPHPPVQQLQGALKSIPSTDGGLGGSSGGCGSGCGGGGCGGGCGGCGGD